MRGARAPLLSARPVVRPGWGGDAERSRAASRGDDASIFASSFGRRRSGLSGRRFCLGKVVDREGPVVGAVVAHRSEAGPSPKAHRGGRADGHSDGVAAGRYNVSAFFAGKRPVASPRRRRRRRDRGRSLVERRTIEVNAKTDEVPIRGNTTTGETFQASKLSTSRRPGRTRKSQDRPGSPRTRAGATRRHRRESRLRVLRMSPRTSSTASTRPRSTPGARPPTSTTT